MLRGDHAKFKHGRNAWDVYASSWKQHRRQACCNSWQSCGNEPSNNGEQQCRDKRTNDACDHVMTAKEATLADRAADAGRKLQGRREQIELPAAAQRQRGHLI